MDVKLECPICLHSLFEPAQIFVEDETRASNSDRRKLLGESSHPSVIVENKPPKKFPSLNGNAGSKSNSLCGTSVTPCGHLFHSLCLQHWFKGGKGMVTCPSCRKEFPRSTIIQLFMDACARESPTLMPMPTPTLSPRPSSVSSLNGSDLKNGKRRSPELVIISSSDEENDDLLPTLLTNVIIPESDIAGSNNSKTVSTKNESKLNDWKAAYTNDKLRIDYNALRRRYRALEDESNFRGAVLASLGLDTSQAEHAKAKSLKYEDDDDDEDKSCITKLSPNSAQRKRKAESSDKMSGRDGKKRKY